MCRIIKKYVNIFTYGCLSYQKRVLYPYNLYFCNKIIKLFILNTYLSFYFSKYKHIYNPQLNIFGFGLAVRWLHPPIKLISSPRLIWALKINQGGVCMSTVTKVRVGAEWINTFHKDSCKQGNLSYRDDHAKNFCNEMKNRGHTVEFIYGNDNAWEKDFRHPDFGGNSLNYLDNVHFFFYSDHGGNFSNTMHIAFSKAVNKCLGNSKEWKLGVKMLKWFVLDCCQCVLNTNASHISAVWFPPAHGVHMIFGFIGNSTDSWWTRNVGKNFGKAAAKGNKLANAWLDAAYSFWANDDAIAIAFGSTESEAKNRRDNETVNWRDINVTSSNWMAWKYRR